MMRNPIMAGMELQTSHLPEMKVKETARQEKAAIRLAAIREIAVHLPAEMQLRPAIRL